jgi:lipopolysaccharide biosynthesis regulator YciM
MREYETILNLKPDDLETSFKLGTLYFQEGEAAKGLRIYERLKRFHPKYAERLIENYGEIF